MKGKEMSAKKYILPDQESISISGGAADKLIKRGDGFASLLYIYMLKNKGNFEITSAQAVLGYTEQQIYDAMGVLWSMGLIAGGGKGGGKGQDTSKRAPVNLTEEADELPDYTSEEITREKDSNSDFSSLLKEVEASFGKLLTTNDLKILLGLYQHLEMSADVILMLVSYCIKEHQDKYGKGKYPTMRGVERIAYIWRRNGIMTLDEAVRHIKKREDQQSAAGEVSRVLQLRNALTPTQRDYIYLWLDMGFSADAIAEAYDRTVVRTGELKWSYLNSIISNWHEKGMHTIDEITERDGRKQIGKSRGKREKAVIKPDRSEIERKKRLIEKLKGEQ